MVALSGLGGSGIDIEALVSGIANASKGNLSAATKRVSSSQAAVSALSGIGGLLSELKGVVDGLDTATELAGYAATSSNTSAVSLSSSGTARPGTYSVRIVSLASEQRTYSSAQASSSADLNQAGNFTITQGASNYVVAVTATDSLEDIATKINGLGGKLSASVFFDGTNNRLQIRSSQTGAANGFSIVEQGGVDLGLDDVGAIKQAAKDAELQIDTFTVTSSTNTIAGAIEGVTLNLQETTASAFTIAVKSNPAAMKTSLQSFVDKYNSVISRIHSVAGYGSTTASSAALKSDAALRTITGGLSNTMLTQVGGTMSTFADLGIKLNNNGTLKLDDAKLTASLNSNPEAFARALAGDSTGDGVMDIMSRLLKGYTDSGSGLVATRTEAFNARVKLYQATADREQARLDSMSARLRKSLQAMDTLVTGYNATLSSLLASNSNNN